MAGGPLTDGPLLTSEQVQEDFSVYEGMKVHFTHLSTHTTLYPCELTGNLVSSAVAVIKSSDKSHLREGTYFYFTVEIHSGEVKAAGTGSSWPRYVQSQRRAVSASMLVSARMLMSS